MGSPVSSHLRMSLDAADPLLDYHRIPRKVVVHEHICNLKINAFGACFSRYDYPAARRIFTKKIDGFLIALARISVDDSNFQSVAFQEILYGGFSLPPDREKD